MSFIKASSQALPDTLDLDSARKIGSFISTFDVILDRIKNQQASVATALYVGIPVLFDLMLIAIIYVVLGRVPKRDAASHRIYRERVRYILL
jgi:hypothetical protein